MAMQNIIHAQHNFRERMRKHVKNVSSQQLHTFIFCRKHGNSTLFAVLLLISYILTIDISQNRLLFGFSLLYTDRVPFELLDSAALL
jgi:hypothetical protein